MALINDTATLKTHITIGELSNLAPILPYVIEAELKFIKPILGDSLYTSLKAEVESASVAGVNIALLPYVQKPLANLSYYTYLPVSAVNLSGGGVRTDRENAAFKWQQDKVEETFLSIGNRAIDELLKYLETNSTDFPTWKSSTAYTLYASQFIKDASTYNSFVFINDSRRTFLRLANTIKEIELFTIRPILTEPLYTLVKADLTASTPNTDHQALIPYIQPIIAHLAIARAIEFMHLIITEDGAIEFKTKAQDRGNKEAANAALAQVIRFKTKSEHTAAAYILELVNFLNLNTTIYPQFINSSSYIDPTKDEVLVRDKSAVYNLL